MAPAIRAPNSASPSASWMIAVIPRLRTRPDALSVPQKNRRPSDARRHASATSPSRQLIADSSVRLSATSYCEPVRLKASRFGGLELECLAVVAGEEHGQHERLARADDAVLAAGREVQVERRLLVLPEEVALVGDHREEPEVVVRVGHRGCGSPDAVASSRRSSYAVRAAAKSSIQYARLPSAARAVDAHPRVTTGLGEELGEQARGPRGAARAAGTSARSGR